MPPPRPAPPAGAAEALRELARQGSPPQRAWEALQPQVPALLAAEPALAGAVALLVEQHGADGPVLAALLEVARTQPGDDAVVLHDLGLAVLPHDADLATALARRALQVAADDGDRLAAHGLAARVAASSGDTATADVHLPLAEHLALRAGGLATLAGLALTRGLVELHRRAHQPAAALAALGAAERLFAAAGDTVHQARVRELAARVGAT